MWTPWKSREKRTTPRPRRDILEFVPELSKLAARTVRLHPRRGEPPGVSDSKLGGTFLWPANMQWPTCVDSGPPDWWESSIVSGPRPIWRGPKGPHGPLAPILQLKAGDFPELRFYPGSDLLQLFWCPMDHSEPACPKPYLFWHDSTAIHNRPQDMPSPRQFEGMYIPQPCHFLPERVTEYPDIQDLPEWLDEKIKGCPFHDLLDPYMDDTRDLYNREFAACPSNKVGGHVSWIQFREVPVCDCTREMEHLLTLASDEFDYGTFLRWCPKEDRLTLGLTARSRFEKRQTICNAAGLDALAGKLFLFICRNCDGWPARCIYQH